MTWSASSVTAPGRRHQPVLLQRISRLSEAARTQPVAVGLLGARFSRSALASLSGHELSFTTTLLDELRPRAWCIG